MRILSLILFVFSFWAGPASAWTEYNYLDQGVASWPLPERDQGFLRAFAALYNDSPQIDGWLRGLPVQLQRLEREGFNSLESI